MDSRRLNLTRLLRPYWQLLAVAFGAMLLEGGADVLEPWPLKVIFDYVLGSKRVPPWLNTWLIGGHDRLAILNLAVVAVIAIAAVGAVSSYTQKYLSTTVAKRVGYDLRHLLYHHVQRLSLSFYEHRQTGDMVVRLTSDIEAAEDFIGSAVLGIVLDLLTLVGMMVVMFYLDWRFSLIGLSVAPVLFVIVYRFTRRIKKAARDVKKKESELASVVQESISSVRVVKAFAQEEFEEGRLDHESQETVDVSLRARSLKARLSPLVDILVAIGTALVLWYGVRLVIADRLTSGALLVFVLYLGKMYKPMKDLSKMSDTLSKAVVSFERIGEILSIESQVRELPGARPAPPFKGRIEFAHVRFGYTPDQLVLNDLNLVVEPGQRAALVGLTGSGKSTLIGLIPRMYDTSGGQIFIDGQDVRSYTLPSMRSQVSFVLQEAVLFRASVAQNIAYGKPGATRDEVVLAAKLANADEFIARLPKGYDSVLGERGDTLSGGQRQRIAIARAIIRNSPILLLDEPSAALDPESEALIFQGLSRLMEGKTSITIAHRLATVRNADVIFVLNDGVISERDARRTPGPQRAVRPPLPYAVSSGRCGRAVARRLTVRWPRWRRWRGCAPASIHLRPGRRARRPRRPAGVRRAARRGKSPKHCELSSAQVAAWLARESVSGGHSSVATIRGLASLLRFSGHDTLRTRCVAKREIQPMPRTPQVVDRQPGTLPDIRTDDRGITFVMAPLGAPHHDQLVIRCDDNGEVWVLIQPGRTVSNQGRKGP